MIKLRNARVEDAPILSAAEKKITETPGLLASRPHEIQELSFRQKIEHLGKISNGRYIVAEKDEKIVGHAFLDPMGLEAIQHVVRLTIAVHPGHEENGIGELLLTDLINWARENPLVEKIELNVRAINLRAIRLYQKLGFHVEGRIQKRTKDLKGNYIDDLIMALFVKEEPFVKTAVSFAIGKVISTRKEAIDDDWDKETSYVELDKEQFSSDALAGLETFSHVEVIFLMNQVDVRKIETSARYPRNNNNWPIVGIFAQRGKNRPNQIGTTVCRLSKVDGLRVYLQGLDAVDGTPVLDIKPWVKEFGPRGATEQPSWMNELMQNYWK